MGEALWSRRVLVASVLSTPFLSFPVLAMTQEDATRLITRVMDDVQAVINAGGGEARIVREFERIFDQHGDVPIIARSVLGPVARTTSERDLRSFAEVFRGYMARKYGRQFQRFSGARAEVSAARPLQSNWEVVTRMSLRGQQPFEVRWHVSDRSGQQRFFNLIIEGVNVLAAERQEIATMLERRGGSVSRLIEDLRQSG